MQANLLTILILTYSGRVKQAEATERVFLPASTFQLANRYKGLGNIGKLRRKLVVGWDQTGGELTETEVIASGEVVENDIATTNKAEVTPSTMYNVEVLAVTTTSTIDATMPDIYDDSMAIDKGNKKENIENHNKEIQIEIAADKEHWFINEDIQNELTKEDFKRNDKSLLNLFPFHLQNVSQTHDASHSDHHDTHKIDRATEILDQLSTTAPDSSGRRCVDKVMMREETEYDEILTCDHSYDERCHTSYVTKYEPHQEQECDENFRKVCTIDYEKKAVHEVVEVCTTHFVKDCDVEGKDVCRTVYESECSTVQIVHLVEDDVVTCKTEEEKKCIDVTEGFRTVEKCDSWPVERCSVEKKEVKKYTPKTSCQKVPKKMCSPNGCGIKEGPVERQDKVKTVVFDNPIEECDMEPLRTCKHVTKLVPKLEATQECVDVPKEICARSKVNPRRVKKPSIQKWCFTPQVEKVSMGQCQKDEDCKEDSHICEDNVCLTGCRQHSQCEEGKICSGNACIEGCAGDEDCPTGHSCLSNKCRVVAGKVLVESLTIKTVSCTGCSEQSEGVKLSLLGERTAEFSSGYPCSTSAQVPLNHQDVLDFSAGLARFAGSSNADQTAMGECFQAPLNGIVRGGNLTWVGEGTWVPSSICVDWQSSNYAYECKLEQVPRSENAWQVAGCQEDQVRQKCLEVV